MITAINTASAQNKLALQNRTQKQNQNFGAIHFDTDSFVKVKDKALKEIEKRQQDLRTIRTQDIMSANLPKEEIREVRFLKDLNIFKTVVKDLEKNKGEIPWGGKISDANDPNVISYLYKLTEKKKQHQPVINHGETLDPRQELKKFYDFFLKPEAPLDLKVSGDKFNEPKASLIISNKENGVLFSSHANPSFEVDEINKFTEEAVMKLENQKTSLQAQKTGLDSDKEFIENMEL